MNDFRSDRFKHPNWAMLVDHANFVATIQRSMEEPTNYRFAVEIMRMRQVAIELRREIEMDQDHDRALTLVDELLNPEGLTYGEQCDEV